MNTTLATAIFTLSGMLIEQSILSQQISDNTVAMNFPAATESSVSLSVNEMEVKETPTKPDVVVNMEMIESFRRCYNKIQPFSFADYFRGDPAEISVKYMAFMRVRLNGSENFQASSLSDEMEKIKSEMKMQVKFNTMIAFSEDKPVEQPNTKPQDQQANDQKAQTQTSEKSKTKSLKWTRIKI